MPIIQVNTWICEVCGAVEVEAGEVAMYHDPIVRPPNGHNWDDVQTTDVPWESKLCCPGCVAKFARA